MLALVNAAGYFLQIYVMYRRDRYQGHGLVRARAGGRVYLPQPANSWPGQQAPRRREESICCTCALAIGFITVAIPIRLDAHWITMGWFVEAAVLLWVADRIHSELLNVFAIGALVLGVGRLLLIDNFYVTTSDFQHADGDLCGGDRRVGRSCLVRQPPER